MKKIMIAFLFCWLITNPLFSQQHQIEQNMKTALLIIAIQNDYLKEN